MGGTDLNDLQDSLANRANPFKYAIKELFKEHESDVEIYLPKFKIESEFSALEAMRGMGLNDLKVTKIVKEAILKVAGIDQKAFIEVDEEGTRAAAVTSVNVAFRSLMMTPSVTMDRPFLYYIYNQRNKLIYFMGKV